MVSRISACVLERGWGLAGISHSRAKSTFAYTHLSSQACSAGSLLPAPSVPLYSILGLCCGPVRACVCTGQHHSPQTCTLSHTSGQGTGCSLGTACSCWGQETCVPWCLWPWADFLMMFSVWRPVWAWVAFEALFPTSKRKALLYWASWNRCG